MIVFDEIRILAGTVMQTILNHISFIVLILWCLTL